MSLTEQAISMAWVRWTYGASVYHEGYGTGSARRKWEAEWLARSGRLQRRLERQGRKP